MEHSTAGRVHQAVDAWLRWVPRWHPVTGRSRSRICRKCLGSPFAEAAGFDSAVPHSVQHNLVMRINAILEEVVDEYTELNLLRLHAELEHQEQIRKSRPYRPDEGLAPEHRGLDLDPQPEPGEPFLFTLAGLEQDAASAAAPREPLPALSDSAKAALRREIALADDYSNRVGGQLCFELADHCGRIVQAIAECVEPQVQELLTELSQELNFPPTG